jgi:protein-S-isoprenylcysteine O-methyltransferase Ste14
MTTLGVIAMIYMVLSRLAYAVGVGTALLRQDRDQVFTRERGVEEGFRRFKYLASWVMNNDAVALVLVCVVTRGTLQVGIERGVLISAGVLLFVVGIAVKLWARETLGAKAYYWYNFFDPTPTGPLERPGPYRYLDNPMYTVGYLPAYGLALAFASWPGLVAAGFAQAAIGVFHLVVEKPHYDRLKREVKRIENRGQGSP